MYRQIARNKRLSVLYVVLFLAGWTVVGALVGGLWTASSGSASGSDSAAQGLVAGALVAALLALGGVVFALTAGARTVLRAGGAHLADPVRHRQLIQLVEALALGDGLPVPAVYIVDDPSPNAFATGTGPGRAAVTVTTGLMELMDRQELEGVLAHELSHIKNYDVRLLLIVSTLIGMAGLLAGIAWRSAFLTRGRGRDGGQLTLVVLAAGALLGLIAVIMGPLVRLALSRHRESLADVSGVQLTRDPAGLVRALQKLQGNDLPLSASGHAVAAMCIDDPARHREGRLQRLLDTHPTLESRIAVLQRIAQGGEV